MSVCIAALCQQKREGRPTPKIFAICDRKASSVEFSNEDAVVKGRSFHPRWLAMFAGNDVSPCGPILRLVQAELSDKENPIAEQVKRAFETYYQLYLSNLATSQILGRYRLSMAEFLETGRKRFGADVFDNLVASIERVRLQCQFLVCGFEGPGIPHIFTVRNPGFIEDRTQTPGYWAIGTGDYAAMSTLGFYQQNRTKSLGATYYNVMAAKFMAEKANHEVGENSYYWQLGENGLEPNDGGIEVYIKGIWEKVGQPKIPEWFVNDLDAALQLGANSGAEISKRLRRKIAAEKGKAKRQERGEK